MDKKNTMLLTVIAVATLLVAVVGATFAYFSLTVSGSSATNATVTTKKPGSVVISGTDQKLLIKVGATEMAQDASAYKPYYAVSNAGGSYGEEQATAYELTEQQYTIATATLTGGTDDVKYECPYTITVEAASELINLNQLKENDLVLKIYGAGVDKSSIDLTEISRSAEEKSTTASGTFSLTGSSSAATSDIKVSLALQNQDADQEYLKDKNIQVNISIKATACSIKTAGAGA